MTVPRFAAKHDQAALISPQRYLAYLERVGMLPTVPLPPDVVLCYSASALRRFLAGSDARPLGGALNATYVIDIDGTPIAVAPSRGIGAPAVVTTLEEHIALGARRVVTVGTAGGLVAGMRPGQVVVADRAFRDEGTSHHYAPAEQEAVPSRPLTAALCGALDRAGHQQVVGATWTTDAPYRETAEEICYYRDQGACCVEMETAAVFTVATARAVEAAAVFVISDLLGGAEWDPHLLSDVVRARRDEVLAAAVQALAA